MITVRCVVVPRLFTAAEVAALDPRDGTAVAVPAGSDRGGVSASSGGYGIVGSASPGSGSGSGGDDDGDGRVLTPEKCR